MSTTIRNAPQCAANGEPHAADSEQVVFPGFLALDDSLNRNGCANTSACRRAIASLRSETVHPLPPPHISLTSAARAAGIGAAGVFDLDLYDDFEHVMSVARTLTEKRGRIHREIARARRLGYYVQEFAFKQFIPDIVDIHTSKQIRDGRPIEADFYKKSIEELGGAPTAAVATTAPACPQHHVQYWGVFMRHDGHYQGSVRTDERLVGYISTRRCGNAAWYMLLMGHGDHLKNGIMYLLHYELVAMFLRARPAGLRYLIYYPFARRIDDASRHWKTLALFTPAYLRSVEEHRPDVPAQAPIPDLISGFYALKQTEFDYWPSSFPKAPDLGISPYWLTFLHRVETIERTRAPGLTVKVLGTLPGLASDVLEALDPGLFPVECLEGKKHAAVVLQGHDWGIDILTPLIGAKMSRVDLFHPEESELCRLKGTYGNAWAYHTPQEGLEAFLTRSATSDLMIVDHFPLGMSEPEQLVRGHLFAGDAKAYLLGIKDRELTCSATDTDLVQEILCRVLQRPIILHGVFFRYRYPTPSRWLWLETTAHS